MNRSRSLRKPAGDVGGANHSHRQELAGTADPRTISPSRLPVKPPSGSGGLQRSATVTGARPPSSSSSSTGLPLRGAAAARGGVGGGNAAGGGEARYPPSSSRVVSAAGAPSATATMMTRARARTAGAGATAAGSGAGAAATTTTTTTASTTTRTRTGPSHTRTRSGIASTGSRDASAPPLSSHTRAKSSATALTGATTLRPPSQSSSASSSTTVTAAPRPRTTSSARPAGTHHTRTGSASITNSSSSSVARPPSATATSTTTGPTALPSRLKPAFTTLQQHYSPAKNPGPKPLTSTYLAPPSPSKLPSNLALSADTLRLQNELLRLHLLHRRAAPTLAAWHASAHASLSARFAALARASADVGAQEAARLELVNASALLRWAGADPHPSAPSTAIQGQHQQQQQQPLAVLEAKILLLDPLLSALWSLSEPSGKYARLMRKFDRWVDHVSELRAARSLSSSFTPNTSSSSSSSSPPPPPPPHPSSPAFPSLLDDDDEPLLIPDLDRAWHDEAALLARKLDAWDAQLAQLGDVPPPPANADHDPDHDRALRRKRGLVGVQVPPPTPPPVPSSLERILSACRALVDGMREELRVAADVESAVIAAEREWITSVIASVGDKKDGGSGAGAIWRAL